MGWERAMRNLGFPAPIFSAVEMCRFRNHRFVTRCGERMSDVRLHSSLDAREIERPFGRAPAPVPPSSGREMREEREN
jgi:hypothetical protein